MKLQIATRLLGEVLVVDCRGMIIYGEEAALLQQQVSALLEQHRHVVLNLAEVSFLDSNGVGTLVGLWGAAQRRGGGLKLSGLGGRLRDVLSVARLHTLFGTFDTAEEAAASLVR